MLLTKLRFEIVIIIAGPSGLDTIVYGAYEGIDILVLETSTPGEYGC